MTWPLHLRHQSRRIRSTQALHIAAAICLVFTVWLRAPLVQAAPPAATASEAPCPTDACGRVLVEARAAGDRTPLRDAVVVVEPAPPGAEPGPVLAPSEESTSAWVRSERSDELGNCRFDNVAVGLVRIAVLAPGFERRDEIVQIPRNATVKVRIFTPPLEDSPFRTVVSAQPVPRAQVTEHRLTQEEIATLPGSQGDPLRALQNLPGVTRPPLGLGVLVIRGAAPGQSRVFMGGHAMPRAFHILSLASVFPADVLDELTFVPGNFDAAYGNATGGIVIVEPRKGRRDGVHGYGEIDLAAASAMVEGPLGRGSFIVAAQRAYIDAILATAASVAERVTGEPTSLLLPRYFDYQVLFDHPLRAGASLSVRAFGAGDVLRARPSPELAQNSAFRFRTDFHRLDLVYRKRMGGTTVRLTPSFRYELNRIVAGSDNFRRRRRDFIGSARAELTHAIGPRADLTVGTDFELDGFATLDEVATVGVVAQQTPFERERAQGLQSSLGVYASGEVRLGPLTLRPGARFSAFTVGSRLASAVDPRGVAELSLAEHWRIAVGLGRHSQVRSIADSNDVNIAGQAASFASSSVLLPAALRSLDPSVSFQPQDSQLNVREALQASASVRYRISDSDTAELTGFWVEQQNNIPPLSNGGSNQFESISRSVGLEALVRRRVTQKLYGWVGYTLNFANLILTQRPVGFPYSRRPSDFDQRHNFVALASYALPKHWRIGGRFRLVSGLPYTPVIGSVAIPGGHQPILGGRNTARLPLSHQLDLRVDKQWFRDRATVSTYIDIQNVYNRVNPELVLYAADLRSEAGFVGLPIFPSLGVRVEW